jgi:uncharacterized radical SAM superfamily protein
MKKAFIVTSSIEVNNNHPLSYSPVRSYFSNEERFRQTIMTVASLDLISDSETVIYILDTSENWSTYKAQLSYQKNLKLPLITYLLNVHEDHQPIKIQIKYNLKTFKSFNSKSTKN